jgi:uncharacterized protein YkwD
MKRGLIALAITLALSGGTYGAIYFTRTEKPVETRQALLTTTTLELNANVIHELVNAERVKAGLQPFVLDERLNATAQRKADEMMSTGVYDHVNEQGIHGYTYTKDIPECRVASENLQYGASDNGTTVEGWMLSKPHREAMLSSSFRIVGYGVSGRYVVQHMC